MSRRLAIMAAALGLAGCFNETANLGASPPVLLDTSRIVVEAPRAGVPSRAQLHEALFSAAQGQPSSVHAEIHLTSPGANAAVRRELIGLGVDPSRIVLDPPWYEDPRPPAVILSRTAAATLPCADAIEPGLYGDPAPSLMSLAHCQQRNNLAEMLVDPRDLERPPRLAPEDGAYLVNGVRAWRAGRATPLPTQDTTVGNYEGGATQGTVGGVTAAPVAATTTTIEPATVPAAATTAPAATQ